MPDFALTALKSLCENCQNWRFANQESTSYAEENDQNSSFHTGSQGLQKQTVSTNITSGGYLLRVVADS
jgi:hypothetical protein